MLLRALLLVIGALISVSGTALAVDHGQFENVPDDIRAWFKGVRSPAGVPCCDISDGHRTEYDVRAGAYWVPINGLWWRGAEKAIIRNAGNPLGEDAVWYVRLRGNIESRCFVPAGGCLTGSCGGGWTPPRRKFCAAFRSRTIL